MLIWSEAVVNGVEADFALGMGPLERGSSTNNLVSISLIQPKTFETNLEDPQLSPSVIVISNQPIN